MEAPPADKPSPREAIPPLPLPPGLLGPEPNAPGPASSGLSVPLIDEPPAAAPPATPRPLAMPSRAAEAEPRPPRPLIKRFAAAEPTPAPTPLINGIIFPPAEGGNTFVSKNLSTILVTASFRPLTKAPLKCIIFTVKRSKTTVETIAVNSVTCPLLRR